MREEAGWHPAQPPRRRRLIVGGKEGRKKAAELWGFAAWYVRDGVGFNGSLVPGLGFSAKLMGEYLSDFANFKGE